MEIGRVDKIYRYPVKSMMGEQRSFVEITGSGLLHDRMAYFAKKGVEGSNSKVAVTAREFPGLVLFQPVIEYENGVRKVSVLTPDGRSLGIASQELLALVRRGFNFDGGIELKYSETGFFDALPVSIFNKWKLFELRRKIGRDDIMARRFRPNLVLDLKPREYLDEERLVGLLLRIGNDVVLRVKRRNTRCIITHVNPQTGERDVDVLAHLKDSKGQAGVYAEVVSTGIVKEKDAVSIA